MADEPVQLPVDVADFLATHTRAFLLTRRRDGAPTIHPMTGFFADGRVVFNTYRKSAKTRNVERDGRAAVVVVNGYHAKGQPVEAVALRGCAVVRSGAPAVPPGAPAAAPNVSGSVAGRVAERMASGKRILIEIAPTAVRRVGSPGRE
jgi:hypothetical protein